MRETSAGIRELKGRLSEYLRLVKAGETVVVTEHGKPVGRIVPVEQPLEARLQAMARAGLVTWSGKRLDLAVPVARVRGNATVADLLVADRE